MGLVLHSRTISLFWTGSHYNFYTDTNCYPNYTISVHRPYTLDIEVTVLSFSYSPHVEFTLYGLTLNYIDILTHRYTQICGLEEMFERSGHQLGHTGLRTPVLIPKPTAVQDTDGSDCTEFGILLQCRFVRY